MESYSPNGHGPPIPVDSQRWTSSDLEGVMTISEHSYPQSVRSEGISPDDTSFHKTLLEIENTFFRTFPAAAHAAQSNQPWGVAEDGGCSQDPVMLFYPSGGDSNAPNSLGSGPAAFVSAPSGRIHGDPDALMDSSLHSAPPYDFYTGSQPSLSSSSSNTAAHPARPTHPLSQYSAPLHASSQMQSPTSRTSSIGSLSDGCRFHSSLNGGQSNYGQPYVTSSENEDDGGVPPMASLPCPANIAPNPPSAPVKTTGSPLPCPYPTQTIPRAISIPPSPHSMSTGYHGPSASHPSTPNQQVEHLSPDPSSSPPSITLYPVPQAPVNYSAAVPWPPHLISEPAPHPPSGRESSSARRRKKNKDNDKKPPLACLFCRGRKIACGPPSPDGDGKTCNQCARRSLKCEYPAESRRGMRKDKSHPGADGGKGIVKSKKRP